MTRFHVTAILAALLGALALACGSVALFSAVVLALVTAIGLGVAIPQMSFFGAFVCHGEGSRRCVALTFDDGPDERSTPALLDLLRDEHVAAAFFGVGNRVEAKRPLAARIVREGHLLENHSYAHSHATNFFTTARLRTELARTQQAIREATGVTPRWFRPPMGLSNPRVFRAAGEIGMMVVGWTARGLDTKLIEPEQIVARILRGLKPGAIILLHDGNIPADRLVTTVKELLDALRRLEYEVVRLDRILT